MVAVLVDYIKYMPTDDRCATTLTTEYCPRIQLHFSVILDFVAFFITHSVCAVDGRKWASHKKLIHIYTKSIYI